MVSLAIVAAFILLMIISGVGTHREGLGEGGRRQLRAAVVDHARRYGYVRAGLAAPGAAEPRFRRVPTPGARSIPPSSIRWRT